MKRPDSATRPEAGLTVRFTVDDQALSRFVTNTNVALKNDDTDADVAAMVSG